MNLKPTHLIALPLAAMLLAGCAQNLEMEPTLTHEPDPVKRHPIGLHNRRAILEIYPSGTDTLGNRQNAEIREFASNWRKEGKTAIVISVPRNPAANNARAVNAYAARITSALKSAGIPASRIVRHAYEATSLTGVNPIRLHYTALQAGIPHECGQWPSDLGAGAPIGTLENQQYWNFACASQANLAAQIDDPLDALRPATVSPGDGTRRSTQLGRFRELQQTNSAFKDFSLTETSDD